MTRTSLTLLLFQLRSARCQSRNAQLCSEARPRMMFALPQLHGAQPSRVTRTSLCEDNETNRSSNLHDFIVRMWIRLRLQSCFRFSPIIFSYNK